ncbi:glycosyltransferase family 4 protein [Pseudovibrio exalbescens]|uniref:glycosyltransferase family 4 protein n=1 Tax=Pseudovibrio exalbescens TaxID=197461 RepID=UPI0023655633|nr:glycosyltransferase family 4 protein [Pseudovibrio exalbescens]MDD7911498.1 glycosyltransferase family 4 protein [Pseudovibrio exalbescens]
MKEVQALTEYLKTTLAYQVGLALIDAKGSFSKLLLLPYELYVLNRKHKNKSKQLLKKKSLGVDDIEDEVLELITNEQDDTYALLRRRGRANSHISKVFLLAARVSLKVSLSRARALAEDAFKFAADQKQKEAAIIVIYDSGSIQAAYQKILEIQLDPYTSSSKIRRIFDEYRITTNGYALPSKSIAVNSNINNSKIIYVSHFSIPYHSSGYATRTHSMLQALAWSGIDVTCVTRPGYPLDRSDSKFLSRARSHEEVEGIEYRHIGLNSLFNDGTLSYFKQASDELVRVCKQQDPKFIIAGSNYVNALPALMTARRLGLSFAYDVRGLWEYTTASKFKGWEYTERFGFIRYMETLVAAEADRVFAISSPLRDELINRGVASDKISLLPNGVDLEKFNEHTVSHELRDKLNIDIKSVVFGFIGTLEVYEGLDEVLHAVKMLLSRGVKCNLVIVGDGSCARQIGELILSLGLSEHVRLIGRVPFSDVGKYYELCDVFVYPRVETHVTRIVPALKPLEAMASKKAVVVSNLPALVELVGGEANAAIVKPGSSSDLFAAMYRLCKEETRNHLASEGYHFVAKNKTWKKSIAELVDFIENPQ